MEISQLWKHKILGTAHDYICNCSKIACMQNQHIMAQLVIQQVQMLPNRNIDTGLFFGPKQYCIHSFVHGLLLSVWDKSIN